ncbi:hypothetical protein CKAN_02094200 [Cinnamomum micranthum f. kanehirae]|uniref:Uncharacterized protein n=1 Tax=Cinnamomum micranthum f. kanehirae TaxID=337451 RepID=A0A443PLY0_9MAGN|nr:hypothetical protein CKAN_02094200 [Cinnamomum micranthum f. kanehirae]
MGKNLNLRACDTGGSLVSLMTVWKGRLQQAQATIQTTLHSFGNGKRDFKVGEELRVQCSSFSSKGIPVMSLLDDML